MTIDEKALAALWQQAFEDTPEFIAGFFRTGFSPDRCQVLERDGALAAALYWFDCRWGDKKVAYIYGVATDKAFRGQGLCRQLMEMTHRHLRQLGYVGAVLVPADRGLYAMYEKMGYRGFCPRLHKTVLSGGQAVTLEPISGAEYGKLRTACLPAGSVVQDEKALDFYATYGQFYAFDGGVVCAAREKDTLFVQEFLGDPVILPGVGAALGAAQLQVRLPGGDEPFAMYHSFTEETLPQYFGIALD